MKTIQCDRCGQDTKGMHIQFQGELLSKDFAKKTKRLRYDWGENREIDLCANCRTELTVLLTSWFTEKE